MARKPIDKEYLVNTLKQFNEQVLSNEYTKKNEIVEGHTHKNKSILDKLTETSDGTLLFDGKEIEGANGKSPYDIAVDNGFAGTEAEWLESLKGEPGEPGADGITPYIGENNNWFIGDTDTGVLAQGASGEDGKDGKSITSITKDENNNIIVTFTDGTTQNIGQLNINVQADFLTSDGFGSLRYYNGHFQYYDVSTSTWIDTSATPDNIVLMNITPKPMKSISVKYNRNISHFEIKFTEPKDTYIDGQLLCAIEKVVLIRKKDSEPQSIDDGDKILELKRNNFGAYSKIPYIDETVIPNIGDIYYYKAFPISTLGYVNDFTENSKKIEVKEVTIYGFKIDQNESDPASMITYLEDCENANFVPAYMDYENDVFNYGDWGEAWFIKNLKPCMLKYDGTVDYELDKNDYTKKLDGTDSDISNEAYEGNAMVGFPKVYWKIVDNGDNTADVYFSDEQIDDNFKCLSHIDNNGNEIDYCYMPIYNGSIVEDKLRSLSIDNLCKNQTIEQEIAYAEKNNLSDNKIWYTEVFIDIQLINLLLILISKNTNTQEKFGNGKGDGYIMPGQMNNKGLFWGKNDIANGVKIFGMENYWGNQYRHCAGYILKNYRQYVKLTYSQCDGSSVDGYNLDGSGYIDTGITCDSCQYNIITKMKFEKQYIVPSETNGGTSSTYYCDGFSTNSGILYAYHNTGYEQVSSGASGAFSHYFWTNNPYEIAGASLSCKPLA